MDTQTLTSFFMWCTIINFGLLMFTFFMVTCCADWAYGMHSKMFGISRDAFNVSIYAFMGLYKVLVILFCAVPYVVLLIIG